MVFPFEMPRGGKATSHWHALIDDFNTSALHFYQVVEEVVKGRDVPEVNFSRVEFKEGGFASAKREYLQIERGNVAFDICAATYGRSYFFSWWVSRVGPEHPFSVSPRFPLCRVLGAVHSHSAVSQLVRVFLRDPTYVRPSRRRICLAG